MVIKILPFTLCPQKTKLLNLGFIVVFNHFRMNCCSQSAAIRRQREKGEKRALPD